MSTPQPNLTLATPTARWEQDIKKSTFIVHLARVASEDAAQAFIGEIQHQERKATHNVWAYVLGEQDEVQRYSDDGEPSGTAGVPMLEVLKNNGVHNVAAVVTRYFGGIKLGAGGLIRAYAGTVADGLADVGLVELVERQKITITVDYARFEPFKYWLETNDHLIDNVEYGADVQVTVPIVQTEVDAFEAEAQDHLAGTGSFTEGETVLFEVPFSRDVNAKTNSLK